MGFGRKSGSEHYALAYEKGIFLRPPSYNSAIKEFIAASEMFEQEGETQWVRRAQANIALYALIKTQDFSSIAHTIVVLQSIPEIERIGSRDEMIKTDILIAELTAAQFEYLAESTPDGSKKQEAYSKASEAIMKLGSNPLNIMEYLNLPGPLDTGILRGYYYSGLSDFHASFSILMESPTSAHDYFQRALVAFKQAHTEPWVEKVSTILQNISVKRCCWMCGREMEGKDIFYKYYPARIEKYHSNLVVKLKQDMGMIDSRDNVTLCTVCGSAIERQADLYATKRVNELRPILAAHQRTLDALETRVVTLEGLQRKH